MCRPQIPEVAGQLVLTGTLLLCGKWVVGLLHVGMSVYLLRLWLSKRIFLEPTDAFKQLPKQKSIRFVAVGFYLASFVFFVYM